MRFQPFERAKLAFVVGIILMGLTPINYLIFLLGLILTIGSYLYIKGEKK